MSEYTQCNYCMYQYILKRAQERYKIPRVVTQRPSISQLGGVDIFVHPKSVRPTQAHFVAWFMELPEQCCC